MPFLLSFAFATFCAGLSAAPARMPEADHGPLRRFALLVGRNDGGAGKVRLRYATSNAQSVAKVLRELGGVEVENRTILLDPVREEVRQSLNEIAERVRSEHKSGGRTQLVFYYSGHSNDEGLLLGEETLSYAELRQQIKELAADVSIVVLDSCSSGHLTRLKGGRTVAPFLTDTLSKLKGYVALTSSSTNEGAQESDRIRGSYFTHYLVSGLRGAADFTARNQVTLNDAYQYAYQQTIARTENTASGPQHPSYSIDLSGSGELVMTDLRKTSAKLLLDRGLVGRVFIRDAEDRVVAEVDKPASKPLTIGLEPGTYSVLLFRDRSIVKTTAELIEGRGTAVSLLDFVPMEAEKTRERGEGPVMKQPRRWDVGFSLGSTTGLLDQEALISEVSSSEAVQIAVTGTTFGFAINTDISAHLTWSTGLSLVYNGRALYRKGLFTGLAFHLLGGGWQGGHTSEPSSYNVSILSRLSLMDFDVVSPDMYHSISGTVLDIPIGLQGRLAVSDGGSLQLDLLRTAVSVGMRTPGIRTAIWEATLSYRVLF